MKNFNLPKKNFKKLLLSLIFLISKPLHALPIGFNTNQQGIEYDETLTDHFYIYHDKRTPHEAAMIGNSLEAVKPILEEWIGITKDYRISVISSAVSENASFANFITETIELQTMGLGTRDLFWHEYVHMTMYGHFYNILGPAGSAVHLPWLPSWFIEGLAESLSVSVGSDFQLSIERYQALTGNWPSYDKIHSLYSSDSFFITGYSTSGAFVTWLIKKFGMESLQKLLKDFYNYSMPWYYPLSFTPFIDFMPFDRALQNLTNHTGKELYELYKEESQAYWKKNSSKELYTLTKDERSLYSSLGSIFIEKNEAYLAMNQDSETEIHKVIFDPNSNWAKSTSGEGIFIPKYILPSMLILQGSAKFGIFTSPDLITGRTEYEIVTLLGEKNLKVGKKIYKIQGEIKDFFFSKDKLFWLQTVQENSQLCFFHLEDLLKENFIGQKNIQCPLKVTLPEQISILEKETTYISGKEFNFVPGEEFQVTSKVWLKLEKQGLLGDSYEILEFDPNTLQTSYFPYKLGGNPLSLSKTKDQTLLLVGEKDRRTIVSVNEEDFSCKSILTLEDLVLNINSYDDNSILLEFYEGSRRSLKKLPTQSQIIEKCRHLSSHTSPLLEKLREKQKEHPSPKDTLPLDNIEVSSDDSKPHTWRGRHIITLPWIGGDDIYGLQYGIMSVPLIDHLQNETIRLSLLFGPSSRFFDWNVGLTSTRFWPTLSLTSYHNQTFNGQYRSSITDQKIYASYLNETGVEASSNFAMFFNDQSLQWNLGVKFANFKKYVGAGLEGSLIAPGLSVSYSRSFDNLNTSASLLGSIAPSAINDTFDYNKLSSQATVGYSLPFWSSDMSLSLSYARTRGDPKKTPLLKEYYMALKTYLPGTGGGINQTSYPLIGRGALFSLFFGDTKAESSLRWTIPLKKHIDRLWWIFFLERLDFSSFLNHGGAWYQKPFDAKSLFTSHGHKIDLQLENKGVHLNLGLGLGRVINFDYQSYVTFGFDALF